MNDKYILAIDGGTQSTKLVIFDLQGNMICQGQEALRPLQSPQTGWAEHPDDDLWDSLAAASRRLFSQFTGGRENIIAVGLCTIRSCRVYLKADGSLASPVIDWMDTRAYGPFDFPGGAKYATTTTGYITHRLTGNFKDTIANSVFIQWPADMVAWKWSDNDEEFRNFNLGRENMMETCLPGEILGTVTKAASEATGIPQGIPVVATASDKAVEALGAGLSQTGNTGLVSLGTYITSMVCGREYHPYNTEGYYTNFASIPHKYLYESFGIFRGMWTISWLKNLLGDEVALKAKTEGISPEELLNKEAEKVTAGSDGLMTIIEWLGDPGFRYKKGIMMGFDVRHTRAHMYRSIMEGIAMTMKNKYDAMCKLLGIIPQKIIVSGGGSNADVFMQIFADVFGVPAMRNVINSAAGLGSAICAAVGAGVYRNFEEASEKMVKIRDEFTPNRENHTLYTKVNEEIYRHITGVTDEILKKTWPIFG